MPRSARGVRGLSSGLLRPALAPAGPAGVPARGGCPGRCGPLGAGTRCRFPPVPSPLCPPGPSPARGSGPGCSWFGGPGEPGGNFPLLSKESCVAAVSLRRFRYFWWGLGFIFRDPHAAFPFPTVGIPSPKVSPRGRCPGGASGSVCSPSEPRPLPAGASPSPGRARSRLGAGDPRDLGCTRALLCESWKNMNDSLLSLPTTKRPHQSRPATSSTHRN